MYSQAQGVLRLALAKEERAKFAKSGSDPVGLPGSRGGVVVGTTASGKPIYSHDSTENRRIYAKTNFNTPIQERHGLAATKAHPSYSAQDHLDAAELHMKGPKQSGGSGEEHYRTRLAGAHLKAASMSAAKRSS